MRLSVGLKSYGCQESFEIVLRIRVVANLVAVAVVRNVISP